MKGAKFQHEFHGAGFEMVHQNGPARLSEWQWSCCEFAIPTATSPNQTLRARELDSNQVLVQGFCIIILSKMSQYLNSPIILVLGSLSMSLPTTADPPRRIQLQDLGQVFDGILVAATIEVTSKDNRILGRPVTRACSGWLSKLAMN